MAIGIDIFLCKALHENKIALNSLHKPPSASIHTIIPFNYNAMRHGKKSIRYVGAKLWNVLSDELRETLDFNAFKRFVMVWHGPNCTCFNCEFCSLKQM